MFGIPLYILIPSFAIVWYLCFVFSANFYFANIGRRNESFDNGLELILVLVFWWFYLIVCFVSLFGKIVGSSFRFVEKKVEKLNH